MFWKHWFGFICRYPPPDPLPKGADPTRHAGIFSSALVAPNPLEFCTGSVMIRTVLSRAVPRLSPPSAACCYSTATIPAPNTEPRVHFNKVREPARFFSLRHRTRR